MQEAETVTALEQGKPTFEAQREEAIAQVRQSVQTLLVLVTEKFLNEEYKKQTVALDAEDSGLQAEWEVLSESRSRLAPITEAKSRVLQRETDDRTAQADTEGAERKRQEAVELRRNFDGITERIQQIESRRAAIVKDKRRIAHAVFQEGYPSLPISTFAVLESVLDLFDGCKQGMFTFQTLAGLDPKSLGESPLIKNFHIEKLIPGQAAGRQLAYRLAEWFRR